MAQFGMQPNIILLKDGTDASQGKPQIISNINACVSVVDIVKSTLGPRGMDKLLIDASGDALVTVLIILLFFEKSQEFFGKKRK